MAVKMNSVRNTLSPPGSTLTTFFFMALISLLSLNTGGCGAPLKNASLHTYVINFAPNSNIIFLQETGNLSSDSKCWDSWSSFSPICAPSPNRGAGVTTLYKNNCNISFIDSQVLIEGNLLYVKVRFDDCIFHLYNVLIPQDNSVALTVISSLESHSHSLREGYVIMGGDFNCTLNPSLDRHDMPREHRQKIASTLQRVIDKTHLYDAWRRIHPVRKNSRGIGKVLTANMNIQKQDWTDSMSPVAWCPLLCLLIFYLAHCLITRR